VRNIAVGQQDKTRRDDDEPLPGERQD